jgi:hypothetical protein
VPYPAEITGDGLTSRLNSARVVGPYEYGGALYVVNLNPDFSDDFVVFLEVFKSTDAGMSWTVQDGAGPECYSDSFNADSVGTFQDGANIVCAFKQPGGAVVDGVSNPQLTFALFDCSADTWGSPVSGGPTVYEMGSFPAGTPPGGYSGYSGGRQGEWVGWGIIEVVRRSTGEYVFVYDSFDEYDNLGGYGYYYRRLSCVRYSGGFWSSPVTLFMPLIGGVQQRDYFMGYLSLGADDTVHIFGASAGYLGQNPTDYDDVNEVAAQYVALDPSNVLGADVVVSYDLHYQYRFNTLGPALLVGSTLYVAYRKANGFVAVASGDGSGSWAETEVAELTIGDELVNNWALVAVGGKPRLCWLDAADYSSDQYIYLSTLSGGSWSAPSVAFTLGDQTGHATENLNGRAIAGGIGLNVLYGSTAFAYPLEYLQIAIASGVGPASRYYGV